MDHTKTVKEIILKSWEEKRAEGEDRHTYRLYVNSMTRQAIPFPLLHSAAIDAGQACDSGKKNLEIGASIIVGKALDYLQQAGWCKVDDEGVITPMGSSDFGITIRVHHPTTTIDPDWMVEGIGDGSMVVSGGKITWQGGSIVLAEYDVVASAK